MNPPNLERWQAAGRELEARKRLDLVGVDHPVINLALAINLEIERQRGVWLANRLRRNLARTGLMVLFEYGEN